MSSDSELAAVRRVQPCHAVTMELGAFSIGLAVKDLWAAKSFYEKLGFTETGGNAEEGWLIMVNRPAVIGLFQGMFEGNI